jgi:hypothetical protein
MCRSRSNYRYDVVAVEDWYADIDEPPEAGNAWFELELGIVVNRKRVPLLPVLVQLIRSAPLDFNPDVLAAHAEADQMLATLPDGLRVALPWGRLKPILSTLGELYFNDKIKAKVRLSTLDAAASKSWRAAPLRWTGGEQLRETGRKLSLFGSVQKGRCPGRPAGHPARLPGRRPGLDAVPARIRPGRHPGRRHGPRQNRADPGPHPGRKGSGPPDQPGAGDRADQPDDQLAGRGRALRPRPEGAAAARQGTARTVRPASTAPTWC